MQSSSYWPSWTCFLDQPKWFFTLWQWSVWCELLFGHKKAGCAAFWQCISRDLRLEFHFLMVFLFFWVSWNKCVCHVFTFSFYFKVQKRNTRKSNPWTQWVLMLVNYEIHGCFQIQSQYLRGKLEYLGRPDVGICVTQSGKGISHVQTSTELEGPLDPGSGLGLTLQSIRDVRTWAKSLLSKY